MSDLLMSLWWVLDNSSRVFGLFPDRGVGQVGEAWAGSGASVPECRPDS